MANATYDAMWRDAMGELGEQLHVEGVDDLGDEVPVNTLSKTAVSEAKTLSKEVVASIIANYDNNDKLGHVYLTVIGKP